MDHKYQKYQKLHDTLSSKIDEYYKKLYGDLNKFGEENIDYIDEETYQKIRKYPTLGLLRLFRIIHYNENHPNNINIFICKNDDTKVNIFTGKEWEKVNFDDILHELVNQLYNQLGIEEHNEKIKLLKNRIEDGDSDMMEYYRSELTRIMKDEKARLQKL
jgi:hypothetical protein